MKKTNFAVCIIALILFASCNSGNQTISSKSITLASLLEEMVSVDSETCFPDPYFASKQLTSYDRKSVLPGTPTWHANDDWAGFIRYEGNNGRVEKVLFDEEGPGVITRLLTTGKADGANLRIYFDDKPEASIVIPAFDISKLPVNIPPGMIYFHEHYKTTQGSTLYYPIPYAKRCKITVDNPNRGYVYHINYRTYDKGTKVETFSIEAAKLVENQAKEVSTKLEQPSDYKGSEMAVNGKLAPAESIRLDLQQGSKAIRTLNFNISNYNESEYAQLMRGLIVKITFDGTQTVIAPLSDFSGGGMGAPAVNSRYLEADGKGNITLRFAMPYKKNAQIELKNSTNYTASATIKANLSDWHWNKNTLYFHACWRQETGLQTNAGIDYNMGTISGRGVFKGDVLSLYNHTPKWYGEGDEHIWVDDEKFPSHFGCGTEDYYNTTYAPIHVYHYPFGGAPREDDEASRGYNTFVRTRNLDIIPFNSKLSFEFELISWETGLVDYASTIYWYGELDSKSLNASDINEALYTLPPAIYTNDLK